MEYVCDKNSVCDKVHGRVIEIVRMVFDKRANEWAVSAKSWTVAPPFKRVIGRMLLFIEEFSCCLCVIGYLQEYSRRSCRGGLNLVCEYEKNCIPKPSTGSETHSSTDFFNFFISNIQNGKKKAK